MKINERIKVLYPHFKVVRKLGPGNSFGELALRGKLERTATVICSKNCNFVTLEKEDYKNILCKFIFLLLIFSEKYEEQLLE
jgi:CRP-like cAMP-binding protein